MQHLYTPLDSTQKQFRLLRAVPGACALEFELAVFSLQTLPCYKALSYRWGDEDAVLDISVNGHTFPARPNLWDFLHYLSRYDVPDWVFVDAVCINQDNLSERSSQVSIMASLYRSAGEVIAWVDDVNWRSLREERKSQQKLLDHAERILQTEPRHIVDLQFPKGEYRHQKLLADIDVGNMLYPILCQPYWIRLWVVQELVLARHVMVHYDGVHVTLDTLAGCLEAQHYTASRLDYTVAFSALGNAGPKHNSEILRAHLAATDIILQASRQRQQPAEHRVMALSTAVIQYHAHECKVSHDHIFGLLGMVSSSLQPDYTKRLINVYIHVLIEGCMDLWQFDDRYKDVHARNMRTRNFHQSLWAALSMGGYRSAASAVSEIVMGAFGHVFEYKLASQQAESRRFGRKIPQLYHTARSRAVAYRLRWKQVFNSSLLVPDAAGMPERIRYSELVSTVNTMYIELLDGITGERTMKTLIHRIASTETLGDTQLNDLADSIVSFPTPREVIVLLHHVVSALKGYALTSVARHDVRQSEQSALLSMFWQRLHAGLEHRRIHLPVGFASIMDELFESVPHCFKDVVDSVDHHSAGASDSTELR